MCRALHSSTHCHWKHVAPAACCILAAVLRVRAEVCHVCAHGQLLVLVMLVECVAAMVQSWDTKCTQL